MKLLRYNREPIKIPIEDIQGVTSGNYVLTVYTKNGDFVGHTLVED